MMRHARGLLVRNPFHLHSHIRRGQGVLNNVRYLSERVPSTIWDDCPGVPHNHAYLVSLLETMQSIRYSDYPAITERSDYNVKNPTTYSYRKLGTDIFATRKHLLAVEEIKKTLEAPEITRGFSIGLIADRSYEFVVNLLSIFSIGARPVLISNTSKPTEVSSLMETAKTTLLITPSKFLQQPWLEEFGRNNLNCTAWANGDLESWKNASPLNEDQFAQEYTLDTSLTKQGTLLFTSGTTGKPKAVFTDISSISSQCSGLRDLWEYTQEDRILHVLPNHHIHGLVNCVLTPLSAGSAVEFITQPFNAHKVLERIAQPPSVDFPPITMFHGVPTMYSSFISAYESYPAPKQEEIAKGLRSLRVAICGSAALPVPVAEKWADITGTIPLERYGMTETGMVLSNSVDPSLRKLGSVGYPMPGVNAHLVDPNDRLIMVPNVPGKLVVRWHKRSQLFHKYWNDIKATNKARVKPEQVAPFAIEKIEDGKVMIKTLKLKRKSEISRQKLKDDWFRTGDMAVRGEDGEYYMLGRESVDIMKVAGHLVSALEIEREILSLPEIAEVAVVGVKSEVFGSIPHAIIALKQEYAQKHDSEPEYKRELVSSLRSRIREKLSEEKLPRRWIITDAIPRNAMGKVNKKELLGNKAFFPKSEAVEKKSDTKETDIPLVLDDTEKVEESVGDTKN
ncbi:hypothetical protein TWF730_007915 [Orbilia blumenaviensis]|uniref:Uncharacterized protein n=1 Tax=Orbilia blumenaviensis TaxID=1796055 RepID=A0AAV9VBZ6_9PEZI